jgi:hypothetical protein
MAAFNWIEFAGHCPICGPNATIRAQCHLASSFNGDDCGRFCHAVYRLGERMRWWLPSDPRFSEWTKGAPDMSDGVVEECCYSDCGRCAAKLYAVIRFRELSPEQVVALGKEDEWPASHPR